MRRWEGLGALKSAFSGCLASGASPMAPLLTGAKVLPQELHSWSPSAFARCASSWARFDAPSGKPSAGHVEQRSPSAAREPVLSGSSSQWNLFLCWVICVSATRLPHSSHSSTTALRFLTGMARNFEFLQSGSRALAALVAETGAIGDKFCDLTRNAKKTVKNPNLTMSVPLKIEPGQIVKSLLGVAMPPDRPTNAPPASWPGARKKSHARMRIWTWMTRMGRGRMMSVYARMRIWTSKRGRDSRDVGRDKLK